MGAPSKPASSGDNKAQRAKRAQLLADGVTLDEVTRQLKKLQEATKGKKPLPVQVARIEALREQVAVLQLPAAPGDDKLIAEAKAADSGSDAGASDDDEDQASPQAKPQAPRQNKKPSAPKSAGSGKTASQKGAKKQR
jgi:hypothetical protein